MKELLQLPFDSSGYGDLSFLYRGLNLRLQFRYRNITLGDVVGELVFEWCTYMSMNGTLKDYEDIFYDRVYLKERIQARGVDYNRYVIMLSGSDFQFNIISKNFTFEDSVQSDIFLLDRDD